MNLTLLLVFAISIPLLVVVALLSFVRGARWFAAHPRGVACVGAALAMTHVASAGWQIRAGESMAGAVQLVVGLAWAAIAFFYWFRGRPQEIN